MSLVTVALRRIRPHLATWLAVLASVLAFVLVTATTIGALTLLSGVIGDASTGGLIAAADPTERSVAVTASISAGEWVAADAAVDAVLAPVREAGLRTVVATTTSRGIEGQPENARGPRDDDARIARAGHRAQGRCHDRRRGGPAPRRPRPRRHLARPHGARSSSPTPMGRPGR